MIKIAFDIATKNIGFCLMDGDNHKVATIKINYDENNLDDLYNQLSFNIRKLINTPLDIDLLVGLEVSNFKNPKSTQRFSLLAGMIVAILKQLWKYRNNVLEFKLFNSNQWQHLIGCKTTDQREIRKQKAKDFVYKITGVKLESEDEADAFCIAYHLEQLNSTQDISIITKKNKAQRANNKAKIAQLNKQIITRQNKLLQLKPTQTKMKERLENEIKEIKAAISKFNDC